MNKAAIISDYRKGHTMGVISSRHNITVSKIHEILDELHKQEKKEIKKKSQVSLTARYKINDWVEPYLSDDELTYIIPNYKIDRLREIEAENTKLKNIIDAHGPVIDSLLQRIKHDKPTMKELGMDRLSYL